MVFTHSSSKELRPAVCSSRIISPFPCSILRIWLALFLRRFRSAVNAPTIIAEDISIPESRFQYPRSPVYWPHFCASTWGNLIWIPTMLCDDETVYIEPETLSPKPKLAQLHTHGPLRKELLSQNVFCELGPWQRGRNYQLGAWASTKYCKYK